MFEGELTVTVKTGIIVLGRDEGWAFLLCRRSEACEQDVVVTGGKVSLLRTGGRKGS